MRTLRLRKWRESTGPATAIGSFYYAKRRYFHPRAIYAALAAAVPVFAGFSRAALVAELSLLLFAAYLGLRAWSIASALRIRRLPPAQGTEGKELEIEYLISNPSAFGARSLLLIDQWSGSSEGRIAHWIPEPIPPHEERRGSYRVSCDAGMGIFPFGRLRLVAADPLGLFEFEITEDEKQSIEVLPLLPALPEVPVAGSRESFLYGMYDVPTRGVSANFASIRDYVRGDSLRHVAWRLSARNSKLLVKEFERIVNSEISFILNLNPRDHAGHGSESSWELAKEITLAMIARQLSNGNSIQLLSDAVRVPFGRGESHSLHLVRSIYGLAPAQGAPDWRGILDDPELPVPPGSTAFIVAPIFRSDPEILERLVARLRLRNVETILVLIEASGFAAGRVQGDMRAYVQSETSRAAERFETALYRLSSLGVRTYSIRPGDDAGRALLAPRLSP